MTQEQVTNGDSVFYTLILSTIIYFLYIINKAYISYRKKIEEFNSIELSDIRIIYFWGYNSWEDNTIESWNKKKWLNCGDNIQIIDGHDKEVTHINTRHNLYEVKNINDNYVVIYDINI